MFALETPWLRAWQFITPNHGKSGYTRASLPNTPKPRVEDGPEEEGPRLRVGSIHMLDTLGLPRDRRGIVLLCGYIAVAAFGLLALLTPPGDPIGWGYIAVAVIGYFFIQTRGLTTFLWLLIAGGGVVVAQAGNPSGWVEVGLGLVLAGIGLIQVPAIDRQQPRPQAEPSVGLGMAPAHAGVVPQGDSSRFLEESQTQTSRFLEESDPQPGAGANPASTPVSLRCIGQLRLEAAEHDLASDLEDKPVLAFLFKYLLARFVLANPQVARSGLGDELSPGVPEASQRERLRKQLYDLQRNIAPEVAALVQSNRTHVWLDLRHTYSDVAELRDLCSRIRERGSLISADLAAEVHKMLELTAGEFLGGFEELENRVNQGRGTAGQVVAQAREAIANQRAELIRGLAEYQDAMGEPEASINYLRDALDALPSRQDLARLLVVAYLKTGQSARASEVRRQFALNLE